MHLWVKKFFYIQFMRKQFQKVKKLLQFQKVKKLLPLFIQELDLTHKCIIVLDLKEIWKCNEV